MTEIDRTMSRAVRDAYARGQEEETMEPLARVDAAGRPVGRIGPGDFVVFYDIRGEREVELTAAFVERGFSHFRVDRALAVGFATMIEYDPALPVRVAFPPLDQLPGTLSEVVARAGLRQVKVTESEKAIHLAYFLNGKRKEPFPGEMRVTPHSPEDPFAEPEMRAEEVAAELVKAVEDPEIALVIGNLPNVDVVGHGEDGATVVRAVEAVDRALGKVLEAARRCGVTAVVTADHGTVERRFYPEGAIDTGHTTSPVPFAVALPGGTSPAGIGMREGGSLVDLAPTVLGLLGLQVPNEMSGKSLLTGPVSELKPGKVLLLICDGWGVAPPGPGNLISQAATPVMDGLLASGLHTSLEASGSAVGLPADTVGNSEAGHLHIGAGRLVASDRVRIQAAIDDGTFFSNEAFLWAAEGAREAGTRLHLLGIVSFFSSHGSIAYLNALLELARRVGVRDVCVHALLGRRGERPESGAHYLGVVEEEMARLGVGRLVSVIGRHWALDREHNWDRVEKTYRLLVEGVGRPVS